MSIKCLIKTKYLIDKPVYPRFESWDTPALKNQSAEKQSAKKD